MGRERERKREREKKRERVTRMLINKYAASVELIFLTKCTDRKGYYTKE